MFEFEIWGSNWVKMELDQTAFSPPPTFQVLIFTQKEIPAFDFDGNALMKSSTELVTAPGQFFNTKFQEKISKF